MTINTRNDLHRLIDALPEAILPEAGHYLKLLLLKLERETSDNKPFTPVALGELWQDITITDEDISIIRQEMWHSFGEEVE